MNAAAKILRKIQENLFHQYIKRLIHHYQLGYISEMQGWFNKWKSMCYTTLTNWNKNYMIISIDEKQIFGRSSILVFHKSLTKWPQREASPHSKVHMWETHCWHYIQWWKAESISSKIRIETRMLTVTASVHIVLKVLAIEIRKEKDIKASTLERKS